MGIHHPQNHIKLPNEKSVLNDIDSFLGSMWQPKYKP